MREARHCTSPQPHYVYTLSSSHYKHSVDCIAKPCFPTLPPDRQQLPLSGRWRPFQRSGTKAMPPEAERDRYLDVSISNAARDRIVHMVSRPVMLEERPPLERNCARLEASHYGRTQIPCAAPHLQSPPDHQTPLNTQPAMLEPRAPQRVMPRVKPGPGQVRAASHRTPLRHTPAGTATAESWTGK